MFGGLIWNEDIKDFQIRPNLRKAVVHLVLLGGHPKEGRVPEP